MTLVIDAQLYVAFLLATAVLMLIPGPNVAMIVANSVAYGTRYGLLTVAGTSSAVLVQLSVTALGMTAVLGTLADWFEWIRWAGVAYLAWLGVQQWRARPADLREIRPQPRSARAIYARGFLVSLTNPKILLFYSAFFPQFVAVNDRVGAQFALLSASFLAVAVVLDGTWAILAGRARGVLAARGRLRNRVSGGFFVGAAIGLAFARRQ